MEAYKACIEFVCFYSQSLHLKFTDRGTISFSKKEKMIFALNVFNVHRKTGLSK